MTRHEIEAALQRLGLEGHVTESTEGSVSHFSLPVPAGAEFSIVCSVDEDGEPQVGANLLAAPQGTYFWYCPLENSDFESEEARAHELERVVAAFVEHPTTIVQRKGLLFWHFTAVANSPDGNVEFQGASCLRPAFQVPSIRGKEKRYESPAIAPRRRTIGSS